MRERMRRITKWIVALFLILMLYGTSNETFGGKQTGEKKIFFLTELWEKGEDAIGDLGAYLRKQLGGEKKEVCLTIDKDMEQLVEGENEKIRENSAVEENQFVVRKTGKLSEDEAEENRREGVMVEQEEKTNTSEDERINVLKQKKDTGYLLKNFFIVDSTTSVDRSLFSVEELLNREYAIEKKKEVQILIYHTHGGSEAFQGTSDQDTSIVAVGERLREELEKYGYQVYHDKTKYDMINGKLDRNKAYNQALQGVSQNLEKYPSIQVIIDLHRDGGATKEKKLTEIDGKQVAQFMIFNGLSRNKRGEIAYLRNPNLQDNLAFGLQLKLLAMERYPELTTKNYLKSYRYNLHLKKRALLLELGNQNNTIEEAENTMPYLAELLAAILGGE